MDSCGNGFRIFQPLANLCQDKTRGKTLGKTWCWLLVGVFALAHGCGKGEPFDMVPVSGKVTYEDGSLIPAHRIEVLFVPQAEPIDKKTYPRQGLAYVNTKDGSFSAVTSRQPGDGVVIGRAKVVIKSYDERDNPSPHVPAKYQDTSTTPLEVEINKNSREFTFKIPKP